MTKTLGWAILSAIISASLTIYLGVSFLGVTEVANAKWTGLCLGIWVMIFIDDICKIIERL